MAARTILRVLAAAYLTPRIIISTGGSKPFECPVSDEKIETWVEKFNDGELEALMALTWRINSNYHAPFSPDYPLFVYNYTEKKLRKKNRIQALASLKKQKDPSLLTTSDIELKQSEIDTFTRTLNNAMYKCRSFIEAQAKEAEVDGALFHSTMYLIHHRQQRMRSQRPFLFLPHIPDRREGVTSVHPLVAQLLNQRISNQVVDTWIKQPEITGPLDSVSMQAKAKEAFVICTWYMARHVNADDWQDQEEESPNKLSCGFLKIYEDPSKAMTDGRFHILTGRLHRLHERESIEMNDVMSRLEGL